MNAARAAALGAIAALLAGCGGGPAATSVYLEIRDGAGAPAPGEVRIVIYDPSSGVPPGTLLSDSTHRVAQPLADSLLGTLVIYPPPALSRLHLEAEGHLGASVISRGSVDVTTAAGRQADARIVLEAIGPGADGGGDAPADAVADRPADTTDASDAGAGGAAIISIDFVGGGVAMGRAEVAGVIRAASWNSAATASGSLTALVTSGGAATTASATWNGGGATRIYQLGIADNPGDFRMMNGYLDPYAGETATVTVSALPTALSTGGYDVYVYTNAEVTNDTRAYDYAIGSTTAKVTQSNGQDFSGTFIPSAGGPGNYIIFPALHTSTFTLTATPGPATKLQRSPINGLQIVPN